MKIKIPDENAPGFIRRLRKYEKYNSAEGVEKQEAMIDWLSEYIEDDNPEEVLINASQKEVMDLISAIGRQAEAPDPKGSETTEDG